jgi:hypothetical protein
VNEKWHANNIARATLKRSVDIAGRILASVLILASLAYAGDYAVLRYRVANPKAGDAFGTVTMERLYAIPQKNGKIEYEFDAQHPEVNVSCVHSLFPHMNQNPCWYLQQQSQKPIQM